VDEDGEVLAFSRGGRLVAVFNLSNARAEYVLSPGRYTPVETPLPAGTAVAAEEGVTLTLPPLGALLAIREG
jgi:alpha-glucosidase